MTNYPPYTFCPEPLPPLFIDSLQDQMCVNSMLESVVYSLIGIYQLTRQNNENAASSGPEQVNLAGFCAWKLAFLAVGGKRGTVLRNG